MYATLSTLPLFIGMNGEDLVEIIHHEKVGVDTLEENALMAVQGDSCNRLHILMRGALGFTTTTTDGRLAATETAAAPLLLEPEILYGIQRTWSSTIRAKEECWLLVMDKSSVTRLISRYEIFRLNLLNTLCSLAARRRQALWQSPAVDGSRRLLNFLTSHTLFPHGEVHFNTQMQHLGECLGVSRKLVGQQLAELQSKGLLTYSRQEITIPDLDKAIHYIHGTTA